MTMNEAASLRLEDQLCFGLYSASRAITGPYRLWLDDLKLTYLQYLVMLALWEQNDTAVKEVGVELNLNSGTLSPLLKRLEAAWLLRRGRRDDERFVGVSLTEQGKALREKAIDIRKVIAEAMGLSPDKLKEMREAMRRLTQSVNAYRDANALPKISRGAS